MSSKTALDIAPKMWHRYRPFRSEERKDVISYQTEARKIAQNIAQELVHRFHATKVVLFGSLARGDFKKYSDIDVAVWGVPPVKFFRAVAFVTGLNRLWIVNLVDAEDCSSSLLQTILQEGMEL